MAWPGPVVLVGHSYGGAVITIDPAAHPNSKALGYIDPVAQRPLSLVTFGEPTTIAAWKTTRKRTLTRQRIS